MYYDRKQMSIVFIIWLSNISTLYSNYILKKL